MRSIIKNVLDDYAKENPQVNFDNDVARGLLSDKITEKLKIWQNQKNQEKTKRNAV